MSTIDALPVGFVLRPPTLADAQSIADIMNAQMQHFVERSSYSIESVHSYFNDPNLDIERDARVVENVEGRIVAYLDAWNYPPYSETILVTHIHPDYNNAAIRQNLMVWGEQVATENISRAPQDAHVGIASLCFGGDSQTLGYLENVGFKHKFNFYRMRIELDQDIPEPQFPPHLSIQTFTKFGDLPRLIQADTEMFRDSWDYVAKSEEDSLKDWQHWIESYPNIDFDSWYVVLDGDEIAAMSLCLPYLIGQEDVGHVYSLGVRENWRRQGLALALLHYSFHELKKRGRTAVTLTVDAANSTGATKLYEKAGMRIIEHSIAWEKVLRTGKGYRKQASDSD